MEEGNEPTCLEKDAMETENTEDKKIDEAVSEAPVQQAPSENTNLEETEPPSNGNVAETESTQQTTSTESSQDVAVPATTTTTTTATSEPPPQKISKRLQDPDEKQFEENVKYLYRSHQREPGKRKVKPNLQLLEMDLNIPEEDSEDDSDYKIDGDEDQGEEDDDEDDEEVTDDDEGDENNEKGKQQQKSDVNGSISALDKAKQLSNGGIIVNGLFKTNVCNICLGDTSGETDEIVECDHCGVTVHEGCYGVSDNDSVLSTGSSASTEPWFCDSCKAGVERPRCELCPNMGGIFKETDAGRWVHLVCALYTPGCAFGSTEKLTPVTLFEMQYSKWGAKPCHLCDDSMMARTGVTINCDAGMCKISFHVTCAQRMGLLSDANPEYIADPFYGHCKVHVDKMKMKLKKRNWAILQHQAKMRREKDQQESDTEPSKERERVLRKLNWLRDRYATKKANNSKVWLPTQKMPRYLPSSATAIEKFRRKADLYGLSHMLVAPSEDRRCHTQVSFSVDFVAYFLDRQRKMKELENNLEKLINENSSLRKQQAMMNELYEKVTTTCSAERALNRRMSDRLSKLWAPLRESGVKFEPKILQNKLEDLNSPQKMLKTCKVCSSVENQHQQIECEQCRTWFHLMCLNPPLARFPKKTKGTNWLCEDCLEANKTAQEMISSKALASARRSRQQASRMIRASSEESASRAPRNRSTSKKKSTRKAKPKSKETKESKEATNNSTVTNSTNNNKEKNNKDVKNDAKDATDDPETEDDAETQTSAPTSAAKTEKSPGDKKAANNKRRKRKPTPKSGGGPSASKRKKTVDKNAETTKPANPETTETAEGQKEETIETQTENEQEAASPSPDKLKETPKESKKETDQKEESLIDTSGTINNTSSSSGSSTNTVINKKPCNKCESSEMAQIVLCDECGGGFHWSCLEPPAKKNPKPRGYTWACEDCDGKNSKLEEVLTETQEEEGEEQKTEEIKSDTTT